MVLFPGGFLWGTATAAHQVEGGNWNNDWWAWEHDPASPCVEPSGDACDHYHRYLEDLGLLASLGFNAYRFSLEWSRIEPEEGEFSQAALGHYRRMVEACREGGLEPVVTLHHFTTPRWVADRGGWADPATAGRFARFAAAAADALADEVRWVCTINEPNILATMGYLTGLFPPGERDPERHRRAQGVLAAAHRRAVEVVRRAIPEAAVGLTLAMSDYQAAEPGGEATLEALRDSDEGPLLEAAAAGDFVGVQAYSRIRVGRAGPLGPPRGAEQTLMGWEFYPEALEAAVRRAHRETGLPVLVTENGVAVADDTRRVEYVRRALEGVGRCLADGVPVRGYCYWSALDNFEWALGYGPTFGLIEVDRQSLQRRPRPSAGWLGAVARANALS
ncbi:MAG: glycosyl hydrolase family protein [Actinobacteria bacterium]|nr:glycosyl hydrolase family protein [Actinomycetota bacterium]